MFLFNFVFIRRRQWHIHFRNILISNKMAEDEKLLKCVFNGTLSICTADKKDELIKLSNTRIEKIETSSIKRSDGFSGSLNVEYAYAHNGCYLNYTSSDHIKRYLKRTGITVGQTTSTADVTRRRRSELSSFSFVMKYGQLL